MSQSAHTPTSQPTSRTLTSTKSLHVINNHEYVVIIFELCIWSIRHVLGVVLVCLCVCLCYMFDLIVSPFLHDRPWISPWTKSISNEINIIIYVIASQLSGHCDVSINRLWCHQQNVNRAIETWGRCKEIILFIVIYGFIHKSFYISMVSCPKGLIRHACAWQIGPFRQDTLDLFAGNLWRGYCVFHPIMIHVIACISQLEIMLQLGDHSLWILPCTFKSIATKFDLVFGVTEYITTVCTVTAVVLSCVKS